jgi:hypothetical protein
MMLSVGMKVADATKCYQVFRAVVGWVAVTVVDLEQIGSLF